MKWFTTNKLANVIKNYLATKDHCTAAIILTRLLNNRAPIHLRFANDATQYNSMIIDVNNDDNYYLLDELTPAKGNELMSAHYCFYALASDNGITVKFTGNAIAHNSTDNISYFKILIPQTIDYQQRRSKQRLLPSNLDELKFTLKSIEHGVFVGSVVDLSATGAQIRFAHNITGLFESSEIIPKCHFLLANKKKIECTIIIRHLYYEKGKQYSTVGINFNELSLHHQKIIDNYLSYLQRRLF